MRMFASWSCSLNRGSVAGPTVTATEQTGSGSIEAEGLHHSCQGADLQLAVTRVFIHALFGSTGASPWCCASARTRPEMRATSFIDLDIDDRDVVGHRVRHVGRLAVRRERHPAGALPAELGAAERLSSPAASTKYRWLFKRLQTTSVLPSAVTAMP